jgi:hypothetical protein
MSFLLYEHSSLPEARIKVRDPLLLPAEEGCPQGHSRGHNQGAGKRVWWPMWRAWRHCRPQGFLPASCCKHCDVQRLNVPASVPHRWYSAESTLCQAPRTR